MAKEFKNEDVQKTVEVKIMAFKENEAKINEHNVFPVPDGDTGTKMLLTLKSIQKELSQVEDYNLKSIAEKFSYGALMGARGNSGVILSQILKGFLDNLIKAKDVDFEAIRSALKASKELAYDSVQNPTEGTMLTTIKDIHQTVEDLDGSSISYKELLDLIIDETEKSVMRTTFLLPVLKQANVVDAGAQGLLEILVGLKKAITDSSSFSLDNKIKSKGKQKEIKKNSSKMGKNRSSDKMQKDSEKNELNLKKLSLISTIKNIYCTELIVKGKSIVITRLRDDIERLGDSALIVGDEKLAKIHIHTNYPQKVLNRCLKEGTLHDIQINNMIDQTREAATGTTEPEEELNIEKKKYGFIAVANGDGFEKIFKSIGVDSVIKGGQSMNPSTYEFVKTINNMDCEVTVLLPNNKNIILTANQAKKISKKKIEVIPTKTIPQGISAMLGFNPDLNVEENMEGMKKSANYVKTGEITTAIRDANLRVGKIKKGEYIGLSDGNVRVISDDLVDSVIDLVRDMAENGIEIITFYYGKEVLGETVKEIEEKMKKYFPGIEIEFHNGGQPLYHFIFSIE